MIRMENWVPRRSTPSGDRSGEMPYQRLSGADVAGESRREGPTAQERVCLYDEN